MLGISEAMQTTSFHMEYLKNMEYCRKSMCVYECWFFGWLFFVSGEEIAKTRPDSEIHLLAN